MTESVVLRPVAREPVESAAVTIMKGAVGGHVGLFYQFNDDGARRHLHLAWHLRLDDDPAAPADASWVKPRLTQDELDNIADAAHRVATLYQDGLVPYAFDANARFDSNGRLQLDQSLGLTCATFIIRLFEYAGIVLLDEQTWDQDRSANGDERTPRPSVPSSSVSDAGIQHTRSWWRARSAFTRIRPKKLRRPRA